MSGEKTLQSEWVISIGKDGFLSWFGMARRLHLWGLDEFVREPAERMFLSTTEGVVKLDSVERNSERQNRKRFVNASWIAVTC